MKKMRLYHFLPEEYALDDLKNSRIKISKLDSLNDPFELLWLYGDKEENAALIAFKKEFSKKGGIICFSQNWQNLLLWSHYANRHKGICLGFDIENKLVKKVCYVDARTRLNPSLSKEMEDRLVYTKSSGWKYEEEWRCWLSLNDKGPGEHYFYDFSEDIKLCEVIAGPLCDISKSEITSAIGKGGHDVKLVKAKLADDSFLIVKDERGFTG